MQQRYFVESVTRMSEDTFAVEIADTRFVDGDADRPIWLEVKAFPYVPGTYRVTGDLTSVGDRLPGEVDKLATEAVAEFVAKEAALEPLRVNSDRDIQVVRAQPFEGSIEVTVVTDRVVNGKPEQITLIFGGLSTSPTVAPATEWIVSGEDIPVDNDVRAVALEGANEERRELARWKVRRAKNAKEAKREAERIVALEEKRIAAKAEKPGCSVALAEYVDLLERRIDQLAETVSRHYEDA